MDIPIKYSDLLETVHTKREEKIKNLKVVKVENLPSISETPLEYNVWLQVDNLCCVSIDMVGSTDIADEVSAGNMSKIYELFSGGMIDYFRRFGALYIDVRGDGGIAFWQNEIPPSPRTSI